PPHPISFDHIRITPWYSPPEIQLGSQCYTAACDMWSMGCIFGELLCGLPLFQFNEERGQTLLSAIVSVLGDIDTQWSTAHLLPKWGVYETLKKTLSRQQMVEFIQRNSMYNPSTDYTSTTLFRRLMRLS
ncbi:MAG: hypothetical protein EZS28_034820, partial [Streblomastix strix]